MTSFYSTKLKNLPGIASKDLLGYVKQIEAAKKEILQDLSGHNMAPLNIANKEDDLAEFDKIAGEIKSKYKKVVILGVGGSSLGAKTIAAIKNDHEIEIDFFESIDGNTINNNLKKVNLKETFFLVISKSGQTVETTCQTLIIIEELKKKNILDFRNQFLFITQNKNSDIGKIAQSINANIKPHPDNIGGRFSYLTIVGLLPASLIGFDVKKIRRGAKNTLDNFLNLDLENNDIAKNCAYQLYLFDKGFGANVIMPYVDALKDFTDWYRQLWAESLGKNGFGSTPINSMGTVDQHSQLQLYLDGPKDKFFTFITNKNANNYFNIKDLPNVSTRFGGKDLNKVVLSEQESTIEILSNKNLPIRVIELTKLNEEVLSSLMMQMFLETILIAKVKKINPFDQPAVESRKILSTKFLSDEN